LQEQKRREKINIYCHPGRMSSGHFIRDLNSFEISLKFAPQALKQIPDKRHFVQFSGMTCLFYYIKKTMLHHLIINKKKDGEISAFFNIEMIIKTTSLIKLF
jgi:hypothetical protein